MSGQAFVEVSSGLFVDSDYVDVLRRRGLDSIDTIFAFEGDEALDKPGLAAHRSRIVFQLDLPLKYYLKRYANTPCSLQLQAWLDHRRRGPMSSFDAQPAQALTQAGIATAKVIAHGCQWNGPFERCSFVVTEEIADARSLEEKLPECFYVAPSKESTEEKRRFIDRLADFVRQFHNTGFRHRDLYLCHIFMTDSGKFHLIDLHRTFKPALFRERYRIKDIAQLYYSAPGGIVSQTDRLRFYLRYTGKKKLTRRDRAFIAKLKSRAWRMADHDINHNRKVPFAS